MAAETMYVTVAGAGSKTGLDWANAMGQAEWLADMTSSAEGGDSYYVYTGTYTLGAAFTSTAGGTAANPTEVIGCSNQEVTPTEATGDARPLIVCGAYQCLFYRNIDIKGFRFTTSATNGIQFDSGCMMARCKITTGGGNYGVYAGSNASYHQVEISGTAGYGASLRAGVSLFRCYMHDMTNGALVIQNGAVISHCIFDTCSSFGANVTAPYSSVQNCTFYNCGTGIYMGANNSFGFMHNNIFSNCTVGFDFNTPLSENGRGLDIDYNHWHNNGDNMTGAVVGPNATSGDPLFTNPGAGDFSIPENSPCIDAGLNITLGVS